MNLEIELRGSLAHIEFLSRGLQSSNQLGDEITFRSEYTRIICPWLLDSRKDEIRHWIQNENRFEEFINKFNKLK